MKPEYRCQVLVIGSGPGGSVTAWTLAAAGKSVIVLEEGPHLSLDSCTPFSIEEMQQKYRYGGLNPAMGAPKIPLVEGCCAGGGSEINSGLYHRTPPDILSLWRDRFQVRDLSPEDLLPHFEACEKALSVQLNPGCPPGPAVKMKLGADRLGWKSLEVPRWFKYEDRAGRKQSMTETLIPAALANGTRLLPGVRAHSLVRKSGTWEASAIQDDKPIIIAADAVFVCCGAIQTPALLRRSGITKNIGNSLALHPTVKAVAIFDEEINVDQASVPAHQVKEFAPGISMGCSISSLPYIAMALTDHPNAKVNASRDWRRMAIFYAMTTGPSSGTVRNVPFSGAPMVRYPLSSADLRSLATGLRHLCRLLFAAGATHVLPSIVGFPTLRRDDELGRIPAELPRQWTSLMTIHMFSSCPMGESQDRCAAGSFGLVHGHRNLFINDASLLCTSLGVNPQGSVMAVARRNALHFLNGL